MKTSRVLIAVLGISAAVSAYLLRNVINDVLIVPLAFFWWRIRLYYHAVPEDTWLTISVIVIFLIAVASLAGDTRSLLNDGSQEEHLSQGPVEELMIRLGVAPHRSHYRWLVANQLARLAQSFLTQREGRNAQRRDGTLEAAGWNPPEDIESYLKYGLRRLSAAGEVSRLHRTNPLHAVEYLESEIGDHYDAD